MQRCLIVDDEMPAREELKYILNSTKDVEVIGEASHGMEALELIDKLRPDIVFLDIQMPQMSGIDVARKLLHKEHRPMIVFVTAYNKFAVEAFEVNAIDYLLKYIFDLPSRILLYADQKRYKANIVVNISSIVIKAIELLLIYTALNYICQYLF